MILLSTAAPATTTELVSCLRSLLAQAIRGGGVTAIGDFPALARLSIDVTGAEPLPRPAVQWVEEAGGAAVGACTVEALEVAGRPFGSGIRQAEVELTARAARVKFVSLSGGRTALRIAGATDGKLRTSVRRAALEAIFLAEANRAAAAQGVTVKDVHVTWQAQGPRALSAEVLVKAKKGFLPATIRARGTLRVDAALVATVSGLSVEGEGIVGSVGAGLIRPKLAQVEGMSRSLLALPLDALRVTDVRLRADDDALVVEAEFAG